MGVAGWEEGHNRGSEAGASGGGKGEKGEEGIAEGDSVVGGDAEDVVVVDSEDEAAVAGGYIAAAAAGEDDEVGGEGDKEIGHAVVLAVGGQRQRRLGDGDDAVRPGLVPGEDVGEAASAAGEDDLGEAGLELRLGSECLGGLGLLAADQEPASRLAVAVVDRACSCRSSWALGPTTGLSTCLYDKVRRGQRSEQRSQAMR